MTVLSSKRSIKSAYAPIDIHASPEGWPKDLPALTEKSAINALSRLYRFGLGRKFEGNIWITSGNRRAVRFAWKGGTRDAFVNPNQGWRAFVHGLSHWLDYIANGEMVHSKHHARLERKLVAEVLKRGWLTEVEAPAKVIPIHNTETKRQLALDRIEARILSWERKAKRAENALAKLAKQRRYYVKALEQRT